MDYPPKLANLEGQNMQNPYWGRPEEFERLNGTASYGSGAYPEKESKSGYMESGMPMDPGENLITADMDKKLRLGFIRRVLLLTTLGLIITFGVCSVFAFVDAAKEFIMANLYVCFIGLGVSLFLMILLVCVEKVQRTIPWNLICLFFISVGYGLGLGALSASLDSKMFLLAVGITIGVTLALMLFACQTKIDFTKFWLLALGGLIILTFFGIFLIFMYSRVAHLVYSCLGAALICFCLIIDVQTIFGGKHRKYQFTLDDYVPATVALYIDIITLFQYIANIMLSAQS